MANVGLAYSDMGHSCSEEIARNQELARLLESALDVFEKTGKASYANLPYDVQEWYTTRKQAEVNRRAQEAADRANLELQTRALAKLTGPEQTALGV